MRATDHLLPQTPGNLWVIYNKNRGTVLHDSGMGRPWTTALEKQARLFADEYTTKLNETCIAIQVKDAIDLVLRHHGTR